MNTIRLSPRLGALAALVPPGARVIDVGTDHGRLPVFLAQTGAASRIWATDIRRGPLESAAKLVDEAGVSSLVKLRLTDGLHGFSPVDTDCVVIAGMGGETILSILTDAPWTREGPLLILSPHTKQEVLRRWLSENGYAVTGERLVEDAGRIYPILTVTGGEEPTASALEYFVGRRERISGDPLLPALLAAEKKRFSRAAPYDPAAAALLDELNEWERGL